MGLDTSLGSDIVWSPRRLHGLRREIGQPWKPVEGAEACYRAESLERTWTGPVGVGRSMGSCRLAPWPLIQLKAKKASQSRRINPSQAANLDVTSSMATTKARSKGIVSWPEEERPRERLLSRGSEALTDSELIAILLRIGYKGTQARWSWGDNC